MRSTSRAVVGSIKDGTRPHGTHLHTIHYGLYPPISTEIRPKFDRIPKDGPTRGKAKKWAYLMEKEKMAKKQCQKIEF